MQRSSYEEIMLGRINNLPQNMMPHYWSELLLMAGQILSDEEFEEMKAMIFDIEKMVLETEMVPERLPDGKTIWVEKIKGNFSLYDIEMAIESNPDFYAFFEKDDGTRVTKFDIERSLNRLKHWIFERVREKSHGRRFSRGF